MIPQNKLKYYSTLLNKKHRKAQHKFIVEGTKSVLEGLNSSYSCEIVFVTNEFSENNFKIISGIENQFKNIVTLKQKDFQKISDTKSPQGIAAVFIELENVLDNSSYKDEKLIVMLDNISDPGNLGTIVRNCDWFGVNNIFLSENIVDFTNPKVIRSSMGSVFHINLFENVSNSNLNELKSFDYEILCADTDGENIFTYQSNKKKILILSSESHGPSKEIEQISDKKICVPKIGNAESLNVASASAVLLAQLTK